MGCPEDRISDLIWKAGVVMPIKRELAVNANGESTWRGRR